ncbi:S24/S26 family peptidase [Microtetraspora malaysiensis]|uniref:S24/S26 family peptidase n=1 Tax=Microtetraspora malaysiensis TaxID=161358 RepID=UPI000A03068B
MKRLLGYWLTVLTVEGLSMEPTLRDGDRLLARRVRHRRGTARVAGRDLRAGDIVAVVNRGKELPPGAVAPRHRGITRYLVKRVAALPGHTWEGETVRAGQVILLGDNTTHSFDSRIHGPFALADVYACAVRRMFSRRPLDPRSRPVGSGPFGRSDIGPLGARADDRDRREPPGS